MDRMFNTRKMSLPKFAITLISMSLILYLFYDFMSFKSKPSREADLLQKEQLARDSYFYSRGELETSGQENQETLRSSAKSNVREDNNDGDFIKEEISEEKIDNIDDKFMKNEKQEKQSDQEEISKEKKNNTDDEFLKKEKQEKETDQEFEKSSVDEDDDVDRPSIKKDANNTVVETEDNYLANGSAIEKSVKKKLTAYRKAIEYEEHLKETNASLTRVINRARYISGFANSPKLVLLGFVCKTCLPFLNSWLCNTKELGIHKSVLFLVRENKLKRTILNDWPDLNVIAMQPNLSKKDNIDSRINKNILSLGRVQLINALLHAGISLLMFDIKSVWFENPVPNLQQQGDAGVDILANIIPKSHLNTGFLVLFASEKTQLFWKILYGKLRNVVSTNKRKTIVVNEYYNEYLQAMIESRYEGITVRQLPISSFTDGVWYLLSKEEREKTLPVVIRNNYIERNEEQIQRAKQWSHWFLQNDGSCNMDLVRKIVKI